MDWMGFYYKLTTPATPDRLSVNGLHVLYGVTCALPGNFCNFFDVEPAWQDNPGTSPPTKGIKQGMETLFVNGNVSLEQRDQLLELGATYGVSEDTSP